MTETKAVLDNWIEDILAFHKRKIRKSKDMESEDTEQFLICEFRKTLKYSPSDINAETLFLVFTLSQEFIKSKHGYFANFQTFIGGSPSIDLEGFAI